MSLVAVDGIPAKRLSEICRAEQEGRISIYPVKQYATIYYILNGTIYVGWYLAKVGETTHLVLQDKVEMGVCWVADSYWFLTREAAEHALSDKRKTAPGAATPESGSRK